MAAPTINDFFGQNAQILTSSVQVWAAPDVPVLVIRYDDSASQAWNNLTSSSEAYVPEKWITAITRKIRDFSNANTDDVPNVVIEDPIVGLESRDGELRDCLRSLDIC